MRRCKIKWHHYLVDLWNNTLQSHRFFLKLGRINITQRPSPLRPWCISPLFSDFPPIFEKFSDSEESFHNFSFSRKISWFSFSSAEISDDHFLVIDHKFRISPYFLCFNTFPPCLAKTIISPLLLQISPTSVLDKFTWFLHTLRVFRFPPTCTFTMMHLCITRCTHWTPLAGGHLICFTVSHVYFFVGGVFDQSTVD